VGVFFMPTAISSAAISRARKLRRNMTDGERRLWRELREFRRWYGIHVRRQAPVGSFVTDFLIHEHRLVIEIDGEHHFLPGGLLRDAQRDAWFASQGYRVIRFNTGELSESFDGCVEVVLRALGLMEPGRVTPIPNPSPQGGGGLSDGVP
jgi:very-short-patch-repair endonuclease